MNTSFCCFLWNREHKMCGRCYDILYSIGMGIQRTAAYSNNSSKCSPLEVKSQQPTACSTVLFEIVPSHLLKTYQPPYRDERFFTLSARNPPLAHPITLHSILILSSPFALVSEVILFISTGAKIKTVVFWAVKVRIFFQTVKEFSEQLAAWVSNTTFKFCNKFCRQF